MGRLSWNQSLWDKNASSFSGVKNGIFFLILTNSSSNIEWIDENGNITIYINETSPTLHQEFKIIARRKKLRRLENIAAYNVARHISGETDAEELPLPKTMKKLICEFLDTFSVDL